MGHAFSFILGKKRMWKRNSLHLHNKSSGVVQKYAVFHALSCPRHVTDYCHEKRERTRLETMVIFMHVSSLLAVRIDGHRKTNKLLTRDIIRILQLYKCTIVIGSLQPSTQRTLALATKTRPNFGTRTKCLLNTHA